MSDYTWVATEGPEGIPVAAFPRKYRMAYWLKKRKGFSSLRLFRLDEWNERRVELEIEEFLGEESK